jgi:hypothetical protein
VQSGASVAQDTEPHITTAPQQQSSVPAWPEIGATHCGNVAGYGEHSMLDDQQQQQQQQSIPQRIVVNKENSLVFPEEMKDTLYPSLKPKELDKVIKCRFCERQFTFLSEHLVHLEMHTTDVDQFVEMSIKVWVPDRRLKCDLCKKFKTSYTLEYARHRDKHNVEGLACKKCMIEVNTPLEYAEHLKIHHPKKIFSEPPKQIFNEPPDKQQQQQQEQPLVNHPVSTEVSTYTLDKTAHHGDIDDTDVIEANILCLMCDEEMLESIFNADGNEQKGILDDSHEHEEESKQKEPEHSSMPILTAGEEKSKAERTKSVDSLGNEDDLLKAIQKCGDQDFIQSTMIDDSQQKQVESKNVADQYNSTNLRKPDPPIVEDEESVDNSVLSLVKDLSGRIGGSGFRRFVLLYWSATFLDSTCFCWLSSIIVL